MIVNVTKRDIKYGKPVDSNCCPIARAMKRIKNVTKICVDLNLVNYHIKNKYHENKLPVSAKCFIDDFDRGCKVKPFKFKL